MDPYLEPRWLDVQSGLAVYASDAINRLLPPGLLARSEAVFVHLPSREIKQRYLEIRDARAGASSR
jgi:hypothetical protein